MHFFYSENSAVLTCLVLNHKMNRCSHVNITF